MKISRERIEQIRTLGAALTNQHSKHCLECQARDDLLTALDERDELLAKAMTTLDWMTDYCSAPNPANEAQERIITIREMLHGSKYERK